MFARELRHAGHTRRFVIQPKPEGEGWEVREEEDSEVLKQVCYTDWHRVERALTVFTQQIGQLEELGWATTDY